MRNQQMAEPSSQVVRNPFMRIGLSDPITCELLLDRLTYQITSPEIMHVFAAAAQPVSVADLAERLKRLPGWNDARCVEATICDMCDKRLLVAPDDHRELMPAVRHWEERGWLEALVLHLSSRNLSYDDVGDRSRPQQEKRYQASGEPMTDADWLEEGARRLALDPSAKLPSDESLDDILLRRRTGVPRSDRPMTARMLSAMLRNANLEACRNRARTTEPVGTDLTALLYSPYSALETWVLVLDVDGVPPGLYQYDVRGHELRLVRGGDFRGDLVAMCIGQRIAGRASAAFVISAVWERYRLRYQHERGYRNLLINISELAHKYIIGATALHLNNFITPAFDDEAACRLIGRQPHHEAPLYMVAVG